MRDFRYFQRIVFALVLLIPSVLMAQGTVTFFGTVSDSSGAVIPGATITINNMLTGLTRQATSDETGGYVVSQLPVGAYSVTA